MSIVDLKALARDVARDRRAKAHTAHAQLAHQACQLLVGFLTPHAGKVTAGYMPIQTEIDPLPAMTMLATHGPVCVPVVERKAAPLRFDLWTPDCEMMRGAYGADVPARSDPVVPQIIIVPLLAFNRDGHRLGYGGGFYDRTLAQLRDTDSAVMAIGLAYSGQEMRDFPVSPLDAPLDAIVTETEVMTF